MLQAADSQRDVRAVPETKLNTRALRAGPAGGGAWSVSCLPTGSCAHTCEAQSASPAHPSCAQPARAELLACPCLSPRRARLSGLSCTSFTACLCPSSILPRYLSRGGLLPATRGPVCVRALGFLAGQACACKPAELCGLCQADTGEETLVEASQPFPGKCIGPESPLWVQGPG